MMIELGILCALRDEYDLLKSNLYNIRVRSNGSFYATTENHGGRFVYVSKCGVGKVNAAICAKKMIDMGMLNILSIGVAGGADPSVSVGDIIIGNSYCYHDVWCGSPNMPGQIQDMPAVFPSGFGKWLDKIPQQDTIKLGMIATGDRFIQSKEEILKIKNYLPNSYNVMAVDMESAAIAHVCCQENIPFMSIRAISDNPLLPNQQEQYDGFWDEVARKSFETLTSIIK